MARTPQDPEKLQKMIEKLQADLDDRRAIERELAHMASFSEMAPNPIVETDIHGQVYYLNPAALKAFPSLESEKKNHPIFEGFAEHLAQLKREHCPLLIRTLPFSDRVYEQQITLLDGGPRVRFYFSDVTELKRLDQLKNDFINMVSHELRSPLTTILASVKTLHDGLLGELTDDQNKVLEPVVKTVQRLARLSNGLLDLSKIEAGKMELVRQEADIRVLISEVAQNFEPLARERGLALRIEMPEEPLILSVDSDKIVEVLTNLVNNALKFTTQGHVELSAAATRGGVRCAVSDTGPGIAENDVLKVFEKFQQFHTNNPSPEKGTGLGLSLCKGIVELHGGSIWIESQPGRGTRFFFDLPNKAA